MRFFQDAIAALPVQRGAAMSGDGMIRRTTEDGRAYKSFELIVAGFALLALLLVYWPFHFYDKAVAADVSGLVAARILANL